MLLPPWWLYCCERWDLVGNLDGSEWNDLARGYAYIVSQSIEPRQAGNEGAITMMHLTLDGSRKHRLFPGDIFVCRGDMPFAVELPIMGRILQRERCFGWYAQNHGMRVFQFQHRISGTCLSLRISSTITKLQDIDMKTSWIWEAVSLATKSMPWRVQWRVCVSVHKFSNKKTF